MFEGMMVVLTMCSDVPHITNQSHTHLLYPGHV